MLLERDVSIRAKDKKGRTALQYACNEQVVGQPLLCILVLSHPKMWGLTCLLLTHACITHSLTPNPTHAHPSQVQFLENALNQMETFRGVYLIGCVSR